jgi:hypothetical protein
MSPHSLFQRRGIGLNLPKDRGVIDSHAAIRQHQGDVAIADREGQIPAQRPEYDVGREVPPFKRAFLFRRHRIPLRTSPHSILPRPSPKSATEPNRFDTDLQHPRWLGLQNVPRYPAKLT